MNKKESFVKDLSVRVAMEKIDTELSPKEPEEKKVKRQYHLTEKGKKARDLIGYQWKPGQSGNPKGRPINPLSLTALLNQELSDHPEDAQAIVRALIAMGKAKDIRAIEMNFERVDGKVVEKHEISGELPVRIVFMPAEQLLGTKVTEIASAPKPLSLEEGGVEGKS